MDSINRDCITPPLATNGISATTPSTGGSMYGLFVGLDLEDSPLNPSLLATRIYNTDPMSATLEITNVVQNTLSPSNSEELLPNFSVTIQPYLSCILETSNDNLSVDDTEEYKTTEEDFDPAGKRLYSDSTPETDGNRGSPIKKGRIHTPMTPPETPRNSDEDELPPNKRTKKSV